MRIRPEDNSRPARDGAEVAPRRALGIAGLTAGTEILTDSGWLPVDHISEGDYAINKDGQAAPVQSVRRRIFGANLGTFWPNGIVFVPDGALGPSDAHYLLPGQQIMLSDDVARTMFDNPDTLIPAAALVGIRGIMRVMPVDLVEVTELRFRTETLIECRNGARLRCPGISARVQSTPLRRRILSRVA